MSERKEGIGPDAAEAEEIGRAVVSEMLTLLDPAKHYSERTLENIEKKVLAYRRAGVPAAIILREGLLKGMELISEKFKAGEVFLAELWLAGQAVRRGMRALGTERREARSLGKVVIGTAEGDIHDIGKNLVAMMLEGAGFEVKDLGVNLPAQRFRWAVRELRPHIVAVSAMLTTTLPRVREVVEGFRDERLFENLKVIVGGAPVTEEFAASVGADAYGRDCLEAVEKCQVLRQKQATSRIGEILDGLFQYGG